MIMQRFLYRVLRSSCALGLLWLSLSSTVRAREHNILVRTSQDAGAKVILLPMEIPPNYGARYTSGFRQCFVQVARETGSVITPFVLDGVATDPALMQDHGIHPTVEAQPKLLHNILPTVIEVLAQ